jgi:plastocyanin
VQKKILAVLPAAAVAVTLAALFLGTEAKDTEEDALPYHDSHLVLIAMSSSRPGCEEAGDCYLPAEITISRDETLTWINEDRGFHTVTAGYYDTPEGSFDSGQLEPEGKFSHTFEQAGKFHYYCRLHPWMEGTVIVN